MLLYLFKKIKIEVVVNKITEVFEGSSSMELKWICSMCTYENSNMENYSSQCEMCGTSRGSDGTSV